ncbi:MAG: hypothetical protein LOD92_01410 [Bacillales bacterium]
MELLAEYYADDSTSFWRMSISFGWRFVLAIMGCCRSFVVNGSTIVSPAVRKTQDLQNL